MFGLKFEISSISDNNAWFETHFRLVGDTLFMSHPEPRGSGRSVILYKNNNFINLFLKTGKSIIQLYNLNKFNLNLKSQKNIGWVGQP